MKSLKELAKRMLMISIKLFYLTHLEKAGTEKGKSLLTDAAFMLDQCADAIDALPAAQDDPGKEEMRKSTLLSTFRELFGLLADYAGSIEDLR